ncbi:MAG: hypothetical protein ACYC5N_11725, partial [Endomicrobiales bacterium]
YRIGGAAGIWAATIMAGAATAALTLGPVGAVIGAAYAANVLTHALYNLFFGTGTGTGAPLTVRGEEDYQQAAQAIGREEGGHSDYYGPKTRDQLVELVMKKYGYGEQEAREIERYLDMATGYDDRGFPGTIVRHTGQKKEVLSTPEERLTALGEIMNTDNEIKDLMADDVTALPGYDEWLRRRMITRANRIAQRFEHIAGLLAKQESVEPWLPAQVRAKARDIARAFEHETEGVFAAQACRDAYDRRVRLMDPGIIRRIATQMAGFDTQRDENFEYILDDITSFNEMLNLLHSYILENDEVAGGLNLLEQVGEGYAWRVRAYGERSELTEHMLPWLKAFFENRGGSAILFSLNGVLYIMVRDFGHALSFMVSEDGGRIKVSYKAPKTFGEGNARKLRGLLNYYPNGDTAKGMFMLDDVDELGSAICEFIPQVRTDSGFDKPFTAEEARAIRSRLSLDTKEEVPVAAILPETTGKVGQWAKEGKGAPGIAARVALAELGGSLFRPLAFILGHEDKRGLAAVVAAGIAGGIAAGTLTIFSLGFAAPLVALALGAAAGIAGATAVNLVVHTYIDWHFIKSTKLLEDREALAEAIQSFRAAVIAKDGSIRTEVYVMGSLPGDAAEWDLKPTGLKVEGKPVWASTKAGALVLFADGVDEEAVRRTVSGLVAGKENLTGSRKLVARFKGLFRGLGIDLKGQGFRAGITVDHSAQGNRITYNEDGSMVVSARRFTGADGKFESAEVISAKLEALLQVRNAEAVVGAQRTLVRLDGMSKESLAEDLEAFIKAGNREIIVPAAAFSGSSERELGEKARFAAEKGLSIYIDFGTDMRREEVFRRSGFAGYVYTENGKTRIRNYLAPDSGMEAETIQGFETAEQLRDRLSRSAAECKIVNLSDLKALLKGGERSIVDRVAVTEILKVTILSL